MKAGGFTLIELLVVVLIIGILAAFGVPQYLKTVETSKAEDSEGLANMVANTNRMYALDHGGTYAQGPISNAACSPYWGVSPMNCSGAAQRNLGCALVACNYLPIDDYDSKPYAACAVNSVGSYTCVYPTGAAVCSNSGTCSDNSSASGANVASCVLRRNGVSPGTNSTPYLNWGYAVDVNGLMICQGRAPKP